MVENKKQDFAERLSSLMAEKGITVTELSERVGVTYEMVRRYTIGAATPRPKTRDKIASFLGTTGSYLEYGMGEPTENDDVKPDVPKPVPDVYRIDVLDLTLSAGPGTYMLSDSIEVLYAIEFTSDHARTLFGNRTSEEVKVMTVNGDSMAPTLNSGDRLFVDVTVRSFKTDGVYTFVFGKTFHVKRLQMQGSRLAVLSDNPGYEKWYIDEDTQDQLYIMGKALIHESIKYNKL
nr:XRE family transcriptional regulator [Gibbsiella quercinecans]